MGSKIPSKTTTTTEPPAWAQPYFKGYMEQVGDYYMPGAEWVNDPVGGPRLIPGQLRQYDGPDRTTLGFNDIENQARANEMAYLQANPTYGLELANQFASDTLSGKYLDPNTNPYLSQTYNVAAQNVSNQYRDAIAPQQAAQAAMAGAFGGSAQANEQVRSQYGLGQNLSQLASDIYGGNYQRERQNQMMMEQFMPQLMGYNENLALSRFDRMGALGANQRSLEQAQANTQYENAFNRWQYPMQALQQMGSFLGVGSPGSTTIAPNPNANSQAATAAGLGIAGVGAGAQAYRAWNGY